jgi:hypothetical protein
MFSFISGSKQDFATTPSPEARVIMDQNENKLDMEDQVSMLSF